MLSITRLPEFTLEQLLRADLSIWCSPTTIQEYMQKLQRWLSAPDPSTNYMRALQQLQSGTFLWFLESKEFSQWKSKSKSKLWLSGLPGCGKTVLSSAIIQELELNRSHTILYFFFDFSDATKRSVEGMVRSLINQLYQVHESTRAHLDLLFSTCHEDPRVQPSAEALCDALTCMIREMDQTYIVVDALDECGTQTDAEQSDVLSWAGGLDVALKDSHLLVTSRKQDNSGAGLEGLIRAEHNLDIPHESLVADVRKYVYARLREDDRFVQWRMMPYVQQQIETTVTQRADGM